MTDPERARLGWRMQYWLLRMSIRAHAGRWIAQGFATVARGLPLRRLFVSLPAILSRLPAGWRGNDYSLCRQNLVALGYEPTLARTLSCRYGALQWQRAVHERLYPSQRPAALRAWIAEIAWVDSQQLSGGERPTLYLLTHTGEHWMAVASLMARQTRASRFVIPIWNYADPFTRASLRGLEGLGHSVEVLDAADPATALVMAKALKRREQVILFCDLPVSLGAVRFGEPLPGRLFHRPAQFVKGPLFLASRLGCDALLLGHQAALGSKGQVQVFGRIPCAPMEVMQVQWTQALERFLGAAPEQWLYLPRLEAFFHRQRGAAESRRPALMRETGR